MRSCLKCTLVLYGTVPDELACAAPGLGLWQSPCCRCGNGGCGLADAWCACARSSSRPPQTPRRTGCTAATPPQQSHTPTQPHSRCCRRRQLRHRPAAVVWPLAPGYRLMVLTAWHCHQKVNESHTKKHQGCLFFSSFQMLIVSKSSFHVFVKFYCCCLVSLVSNIGTESVTTIFPWNRIRTFLVGLHILN